MKVPSPEPVALPQSKTESPESAPNPEPGRPTKRQTKPQPDANRSRSVRRQKPSVPPPEDPKDTVDLPRVNKSRPVEKDATRKDTTPTQPPRTADRTTKERTAETEIETDRQVDVAPPVDRGDFAAKAPSYYRGIYINNAYFRSKQFPAFLKTAAAAGMNTLVIDIQPSLPSAETMKAIHDAGFYTVARVVVFPDGLKTYPASSAMLERILDRAEQGAKAGFAEVQLDYIRFADNLHVSGLTIEKRYRYLSGLLLRFEERLRPYRVRLGGDIFGRIAFNRNDIIGQKLEVFDAHLDTIYPMLYPSHFYGDAFRRRQPYRTVLEGTRDSRLRTKNSRIVPYIQAFSMKVSESGLSLEDYIRAQIDGAKDSGGGGYIVWNARNDYRPFFRALGKGRLIQATARKESVAPGVKPKNQSM